MLTNVIDKYIYQGNGSNTTFAVQHQIIVNDINEIGVILRDETNPSTPVITVQTYGAMQNYTLSGQSLPTIPFNNTVVMNVAPTANQKIIIYRIIPLTELLNLLTSGNFDYTNINTEFMRVVAMLQQLNEVTTRSPLLSIGTTNTGLQIPEPVANTVLGFDSNKNLILYSQSQVPSSSETQVAAADNTGGQALTGFSVSALVYSLITVDCSILRQSSNGTLRERSRVILSYDNTNAVWRLANPTDGPDLTGVTFAVSTSGGVGTLSFTTDSFSLGGSSYVGKIRYKVTSGFLLET
jgi:hypothetical protein